MRGIAGLFLLPGLAAAAGVNYERVFRGNGGVRIAVVASDAAGNVYVAGTTTAFDLPVKNAAQPANPGSAAVVSEDGGTTWAPLGFIPDLPHTGVRAPAANPRDPTLLISSGTYGIYRSTDSGRSWRTVLELKTADERVRVGYVDRVERDPRNLPLPHPEREVSRIW
jgi:hypothetical protein